MKKHTCQHCNQVIDFGVDLKGLGEINDAIRQHEDNCVCNDETIVRPISVHRFKRGANRLMKLTGTIFSPAQSLNNLKDSTANIKTIASELSDPDMEMEAEKLEILVFGLESKIREKYIFA